MSEALTQFEETYKQAEKDLEKYQNMYTDSMNSIRKHAVNLPDKERAKHNERMMRIKELTKKRDTKGLMDLLEEVKAENK
jgi:uncharacterized protein YukE